jgi:serine protease AprX
MSTHPRRFFDRVVSGVALAGLTTVGLPAAALAAASGPAIAVIVEAHSVGAAGAAVAAVDGHTDLQLPLIAAVSAHVDADQFHALADNPNVAVMPDATMHPTSLSYSAANVDTQVAALDPGSDLSPNAGQGVGVALIDTGVTATPDLNGSRLVQGPDLSSEGDGIDHYGHGTFMAGLIAGDGTASANGAVHHVGVAPGATLVAVKVAGADGSTTVSKIIAGIGWVVTHRDAYNIRVLNLSFGIDVPMPYQANALDAASEAAWASGIAVVASAGNEGAGNVTSPGDDPYVITAGAVDTNGTASTSNDTVPSWSGTQTFHDYSKPDILAPGVSVVSLRDPGSTIDTQHPEGRVDATYFRGGGTSMSTALVSGAAAILAAHHPNATPDDIKGALVDTGAAIAGSNAPAVDLQAADNATASPAWWQHFHLAFGDLGIKLHDGMPWTSSRWTADNWESSRWTAARWTAARWTAEAWTSARWTAETWTSARWTAVAWPSQSWG